MLTIRFNFHRVWLGISGQNSGVRIRYLDFELRNWEPARRVRVRRTIQNLGRKRAWGNTAGRLQPRDKLGTGYQLTKKDYAFALTLCPMLYAFSSGTPRSRWLLSNRPIFMEHNYLQLSGFDLTVEGKEVRLTQTAIRWKANYDLTKEWSWLPPIW